jgi:hypothetical protein
MAIKLPDATVRLTGEEQYVLTLILQSAKRQMEDWEQKRRPDIARHTRLAAAFCEMSIPKFRRKEVASETILPRFCGARCVAPALCWR